MFFFAIVKIQNRCKIEMLLSLKWKASIVSNLQVLLYSDLLFFRYISLLCLAFLLYSQIFLPPAATRTVAMTVEQRTARTLLPSASSLWAWARSCFLKDTVTVRARGTATAREECTPTVAAKVTCLTLTLLLCRRD